MKEKEIPQPIMDWIEKKADEGTIHITEPVEKARARLSAKWGMEAMYGWIHTDPAKAIEYVVELFAVSDRTQRQIITEQEEKLASYATRITEESARVVRLMEENRRLAALIERHNMMKDVLRDATELIRVQSEKIAKLENRILTLEQIQRMTKLALLHLKEDTTGLFGPENDGICGE